MKIAVKENTHKRFFMFIYPLSRALWHSPRQPGRQRPGLRPNAHNKKQPVDVRAVKNTCAYVDRL